MKEPNCVVYCSYARGVTYEGDFPSFNEKLYDKFKLLGVQFYSEHNLDVVRTAEGRIVPYIVEIHPYSNVVSLVGTESNLPSSYHTEFSSFGRPHLMAISECINGGTIIFGIDYSSFSTEYWIVRPNSIEPVNVIDAIITAKNL